MDPDRRRSSGSCCRSRRVRRVLRWMPCEVRSGSCWRPRRGRRSGVRGVGDDDAGPVARSWRCRSCCPAPWRRRRSRRRRRRCSRRRVAVARRRAADEAPVAVDLHAAAVRHRRAPRPQPDRVAGSASRTGRDPRRRPVLPEIRFWNTCAPVAATTRRQVRLRACAGGVRADAVERDVTAPAPAPVAHADDAVTRDHGCARPRPRRPPRAVAGRRTRRHRRCCPRPRCPAAAT